MPSLFAGVLSIPNFHGRPIVLRSNEMPLQSHPSRQIRSVYTPALAFMLVAGLIAAGLLLRVNAMTSKTLWVDEAESAINGLTILGTGLPKDTYLGLPIYENTLTEKWEGHPEYEFRDSSYSSSGVAVYHGWLPLYAIAAAQALFQMEPDVSKSTPEVIHGADEILFRTVVPRLPALLFSLGTMIAVFLLGKRIGGFGAGLAALVWISLAARAVDFGFQSRYYSLALLMSTLAAWSLWRTVNLGTWGCFITLGIAEGLLFHTHQLSSVVFAAAASITIPRLMNHERWIEKSAAAVGIALLLTVPWALWSGFFQTASNVPKVFRLFASWRDWVSYIFDHPLPVVIILPAILLIAVLRFCPRRLPRRLRTAARVHAPIYTFLMTWMILIYGAFHTLVPAASYFEGRMTLMLMIPYILLLGLLIADVSLAVPKSMSTITALTLAFLSLLAIHRIDVPTGLYANLNKSGIASVIKTLEDLEYDADIRFYATPNEHLVNTYYTGLPVQSIAPVRSSFLDGYSGTIVFLEKQMTPPIFPSDDIRDAVAPAGSHLDDTHVETIQDALWKHVVGHKLRARGLATTQPPPLPTVAESLWEEYAAYCREAESFQRDFLKKAPIFRDVLVEQNEDLWDAFFVRFVDYQSRVGEHRNIHNRLKHSEVTYIPEALTVFYVSRSPGVAE